MALRCLLEAIIHVLLLLDYDGCFGYVGDVVTGCSHDVPSCDDVGAVYCLKNKTIIISYISTTGVSQW